jgi:hypothetical protein
MTKNVIDYLHLYLGCKIKKQGKIQELDSRMLARLYAMEEYISGFLNNEVKLILRPLYDITTDELMELQWRKCDFDLFKSELKMKGKLNIKPSELAFLLRQNFDIFDLIDSGIALND